MQRGRLLRRAETLPGPGRDVRRVDHRPGEGFVALDAAQGILQRLVENPSELHLRLGTGWQAEDEPVLVHLRASQVGIDLGVGEGGDGRGIVERQLDLPGHFDEAASRRHEERHRGQLARLRAADWRQESGGPPILDALIAASERAHEFFPRSSDGDVGEAALFGKVQFGGREFFLQELVG